MKPFDSGSSFSVRWPPYLFLPFSYVQTRIVRGLRSSQVDLKAFPRNVVFRAVFVNFFIPEVIARWPVSIRGDQEALSIFLARFPPPVK